MNRADKPFVFNGSKVLLGVVALVIIEQGAVGVDEDEPLFEAVLLLLLLFKFPFGTMKLFEDDDEELDEDLDELEAATDDEIVKLANPLVSKLDPIDVELFCFINKPFE